MKEQVAVSVQQSAVSEHPSGTFLSKLKAER